MSSKLSKINKLGKNGKYDLALKEIEKLQKTHIELPQLLVLKSLYIYLSDNKKYKLSDVKTYLQNALKIDDQNIEALTELASYINVVEDKPSSAIKLYERAIELLRNDITNVVIQYTNCLIELDENKKAQVFLNNLLDNLIDRHKIQEYSNEIVDYDDYLNLETLQEPVFNLTKGTYTKLLLKKESEQSETTIDSTGNLVFADNKDILENA